MIAFDPIFGGGPKGYNAMVIGGYIDLNPEKFKGFKEACLLRDELIERYRAVIPISQICRANGLIYGCESSEEYGNKFLVWVLMNSYNVFDESHTRYKEILSVIERYNPEWTDRFKRDHDRKVRICKVNIFPIK